MSEAEAGRAGATSDAAAAASAREPESPGAAASTTRDLEVADESKPQPQARAVTPEREARRAVPETGESASPYARTPTPNAHAATPNVQSATPLPVQMEEAAASRVSDDVSEDRRGRVARVREGTRARVENTRARVERAKGDALVALEETPDDSGLRFVLVTVVLFVLFIAFLFLSVTILR